MPILAPQALLRHIRENCVDPVQRTDRCFDVL